MLPHYKVGDIAYLVESNRFIREGKITNICGDIVTFKFIEHGGTKVKAHRLFPTEEAAQSYIDALKPPKKVGNQRKFLSFLEEGKLYHIFRRLC